MSYKEDSLFTLILHTFFFLQESRIIQNDREHSSFGGYRNVCVKRVQTWKYQKRIHYKWVTVLVKIQFHLQPICMAADVHTGFDFMD